MKNLRSIGTFYEKEAGVFLEKSGYRILEYNFRCYIGEIDLIARDGSYFVFCEVKYRKTHRKGYPMEAVDQRKQLTIGKCALLYLAMHHYHNVPCRFDVISIENGKITHLKNAFEYTGE